MKTRITFFLATVLMIGGNPGFAQSQDRYRLSNLFRIEKNHDASSMQRIAQEGISHSPDQTMSNVYHPYKKIDSRWDEINSSWEYNDSACYTYNSAGNRTQVVYYDQFGNNDNKYIYSYNASGYLSQTLNQYWDGYLWVNSNRITYLYTSNGKILERTTQWWDSYYGNWLNNSRSSYTYNFNGDLMRYNYQSWNDVMNSWENHYRDNYAYNSSNQLSEINYQNWNDTLSNWENEFKYAYAYAVSGEINGVLWYTWDGSSWYQIYGIVNIVWYQWTGSLLNNGNKLSAFLQQEWNGSTWENAYLVNYSYDAFGNRTNYTEFSWQNNSWAINYKSNYIYTYDADNNITEDIWQHWDFYTQSLVNYWKINYSEYHVFTAVDEINSNNKSMVVYPNPSHANSIIEVEKLDIDEVCIYNIHGKRILNKKVSSNFSSIEIERNDLPAGVYLIRAINKNNMTIGTTKWILE